MNYILVLVLMLTSAANTLIFDFSKDANLRNWRVVDDVVMGGRSDGDFSLSEDGYGEFKGHVSLENNGGFSSVRYNFETMDVQGRKKIHIRLKGDGKKYQFRVKENSRDYYSYIAYFETTGEWQDVLINLKDMYPSYRGMRLNQPNFKSDSMEEIAFLIANKKDENFQLLIDKIELK